MKTYSKQTNQRKPNSRKLSSEGLEDGSVSEVLKGQGSDCQHAQKSGNNSAVDTLHSQPSQAVRSRAMRDPVSQKVDTVPKDGSCGCPPYTHTHTCTQTHACVSVCMHVCIHACVYPHTLLLV